MVLKVIIVSAWALLSAGIQADLGQEIEKAIHGMGIRGDAFSSALHNVLNEFSGGDPQGYSTMRTLGDSRGVWVTAAESSGPGHQYVFIWPDRAGNHAQAVYRYRRSTDENRELPMAPDGEVYWRGDRLIIAGYDDRSTNAGRASVYLYRLRSGRWKLVQHLSGGPFGLAKFARSKGGVEPNRVAVEISGFPYHLSVPTGGPFLDFRETWVYRSGKYHRGKAALTPSALAELDRLGGYVDSKNRMAFNRAVRPQWRTRLWKALGDREGVTWDDSLAKVAGREAFRVGARTRVVLRKAEGRWAVSSVQAVRGD